MFKRGDIVMYTPQKAFNMRMWQHLEGAIGIVTGVSPETRVETKRSEYYSDTKTHVNWIHVPVPGELNEPDWATAMVGLLTKLEASNG